MSAERERAHQSGLAYVQRKVAAHMDKIVRMFKPNAKITVTVRHPCHPDQDFIMTSDEPSEIIAMLQRRAADRPAAPERYAHALITVTDTAIYNREVKGNQRDAIKDAMDSLPPSPTQTE